MNYRNWASALAAGVGIATVLATPPTLNLPDDPAQQVIRLKSVEDILGDSKFVPVCSDSIQDQIANSRGILFFYRNGDGSSYDHDSRIDFEANQAMAAVLRRVSKKFPDFLGIKYLKVDLDCDGPAAGTDGNRTLIQRQSNMPVPYILMYRYGKVILPTWKSGRSLTLEPDMLEQRELLTEADIIRYLILR